MKSAVANRQHTRSRPNATERDHSKLEKFWFGITTVWLQAMVMTFVVFEIQERIHTPASHWIQKLVRLVGEL